MKNRLKLFSKTSALITVMMGAVVLIGWLFDITLLKTIIPNYVTVKANTALCFLSLGIALWLINKTENISSNKKIIISLCSLLPIVTGLFTLSEYIFDIDLRIDELFFKDNSLGEIFLGGRMSPIAAFNFCIAGFALYLSALKSVNYKTIQLLILLIFSISLLAFSVYIFDVENMHGISFYTQGALHTSLIFIIFSLGLLTAHAENGIVIIFTSNTIGGVVARRLIPVVIILPLFLGWLRLQGENYGLYGTAFGVTMFSIATIFIFIVVILWNAQHLMKLDKELAFQNDEKEKRAAELGIANKELVFQNEEKQKLADEQVIDITQHKQAEQALKESEEKFRDLSNNISQLVWMADAQGYIFWYNHRWFEFTGTTLEEMKGWGWQKVHHPDYVKSVVDKIKYSFETGEIWEDTFPLRGKDGKYRWFLSRAVPIRDEHGTVLRWFGTNTDITENKQAEQALKESETKYRLQSEEKEKQAAELIIANKQLEQFVYIASHDLQEPLRTISNFAGLIEEEYSGKLDKDTNQYFEFILAATSKMQNLIKDLLDYSRLGIQITVAYVDCNVVLKEVIAEMGASIKESNAKITSTILPVIKGNEIQLKQLFQNLISNAIKFHKKNVTPEIEITVEEKDTEYVFSIKDNGIGIEKKDIGKLFVVFKRLHSASEYPGTGIGLATVKKIVDQHKGKTWVESKLGDGSTFYFTIPK